MNISTLSMDFLYLLNKQWVIGLFLLRENFAEKQMNKFFSCNQR